jgi:hypothetical protein
MKVLVRKMDKLGLLRFVLIYYAVIYIVLALVLPVTIAVLDFTLFANPTILCMCITALLFFGTIGYFSFIRPYIIYQRLPQVLAETDGEFVYFHGKKEAKISLNDLSYCYMNVNVPYIFQHGFIREFVIHKFSSNYGSIVLNVPNHGTIKMPFVANAEDVGGALINYINRNSD